MLQYVARHSRVARELVLCGMCVCRVLRSSAHVTSLIHTLDDSRSLRSYDFGYLDLQITQFSCIFLSGRDSRLLQ